MLYLANAATRSAHTADLVHHEQRETSAEGNCAGPADDSRPESEHQSSARAKLEHDDQNERNVAISNDQVTKDCVLNIWTQDLPNRSNDEYQTNERTQECREGAAICRTHRLISTEGCHP